MVPKAYQWVSPKKLYFFHINTIGNSRTQTCINAAQVAQHYKAHALNFFINCRLSPLIAGMQDEQFVSKGQLSLNIKMGLTDTHCKLSDYYHQYNASPFYTWAIYTWQIICMTIPFLIK
jgi:hypothetical protein